MLCFMHYIFLIIRSDLPTFSTKISSLVCPRVKCHFFVPPSLNDPSISQSPSPSSLYRDHFLKLCLNTIYYFENEDRNLFRNVRAISLTWRLMTEDSHLQYINVYWSASYEISAEHDITGFSFGICMYHCSSYWLDWSEILHSVVLWISVEKIQFV